MAITENESKLIAIFVQSCLWGAFAVMFVLTYWTLVHRRPRGRPLNKSMLGVAILMFVLATTQLAVNFARVIKGFIIFGDNTEVFYNQLAEFTQVFGSTMYIVQTFVGDGVAIYRCYVVWSRSRMYAAVPAFLYIGSLVTGIGILVTMGQANDGSLVFFEELGRWISSFFAFTLVTSTTCTLMIASRIWFLSHRSASNGVTRSLHPIALVIVESGAIYSAMLIALLILYGQKSWFQYVIVDALSSLIGIVFSVIIVRVGLGVATEPETIQRATVSSRTAGASGQGRGMITHQLSTFTAPTMSETTSQHEHWNGIKVDVEKTADSTDTSLQRKKSAESQS